MQAFRARVRNGRLELDGDSSELSEGQVYELVAIDAKLAGGEDDLDEGERLALSAELDFSNADADAGRVEDAGLVIAALRGQR